MIITRVRNKERDGVKSIVADGRKLVKIEVLFWDITSGGMCEQGLLRWTQCIARHAGRSVAIA